MRLGQGLGIGRGGGVVAVNTELGTNFLTAPEDRTNAAWTKVGLTVAASAEAPPPGVGISACQKLIEDAAGSFKMCNQDGTDLVSTGASFIYSLYMKSAERSACYMAFSGQATGKNRYFELDTPAAGTGTTIDQGIIDIGDGWYRLWVEGVTGGAGGVVDIDFAIANPHQTISYTGDGSSGVLVAGAMLELATGGPTAYSST